MRLKRVKHVHQVDFYQKQTLPNNNDCHLTSRSQYAKHGKMDTLMDIEYVQASKTHQCIRKLAILLDDGETSFVEEFKPSMPWQFLE